MNKLLLLLLSLLPFVNIAQKITGKVLDKSSNTPIAYANIGIVGKSIGTVSDEKGLFSLNLENSSANDTLMISVIGYESQILTVAATKQRCTKDCIFLLSKISYELKEVEIASRKLTRRVVGVPNPNENISIGYQGQQLGQELGIFIKNKKPAFLQEVSIYVGKCEGDSVTFRLNVYNEKKGMPKDNILKAPIYLNYACKDVSPAFKVDISKENIYLVSHFFITLENIKENKVIESFLFSGKLFNGGSYFRDTSQSSWEKFPIISLGISAIILQED